MRADRMVAILLMMQTRGRLTAAAVADELEVSVSTARRDLESLAMSGVPVYPLRGRQGGWALVGGARTDLTGLSAPEVRALFLLTGRLEMSPTARSALRKLLVALPAPFRTDAEVAANAVFVDPRSWGGGPGPSRPVVLDVIEQAVIDGRQVEFDYAKPGCRPERRLVHPWGVVVKADQWYVVAGTDDGRRTFRADRISDIHLLDLAADRPDRFELAREWSDVVNAVEQARGRVSAVVLVEADRFGALNAHFGRHSEVIGHEPDGRARLRLRAQSVRALAEQLAGWSRVLAVIEPASVRNELARIGIGLVNSYGGLPKRSGATAVGGGAVSAANEVGADDRPSPPLPARSRRNSARVSTRARPSRE